MIKKFNLFINESLKDKLKGKSESEINNAINKSYKKLIEITIEDGFTDNIKEADEFWYRYFYDIKKLLFLRNDIIQIYEYYLDELYEYFQNKINIPDIDDGLD